MTAVDTSVVVPGLLAWHEHHERCRPLLSGARIPADVLIESYSVALSQPSCPAKGRKETLLGADPVISSTTAHDDGHPEVLVDLDELVEVITESWRGEAPKKVLAAHPDIAPGPE